jgi:hypothetical protein
MSATSEERRAGQRDVEQALVRLLTMYSAVSRSLSEWEQYCLSSALVFERHGYFEKALIKIGEVLEPVLTQNSKKPRNHRVFRAAVIAS